MTRDSDGTRRAETAWVDTGASQATGLSQATPLRVDGPSGFDPSRVASRLGKRQRECILALSEDWGAAPNHQCAKRLWYGEHYLIDHKHRTDNCWRLNSRGVSVKMVLFLGASA